MYFFIRYRRPGLQYWFSQERRPSNSTGFLESEGRAKDGCQHVLRLFSREQRLVKEKVPSKTNNIVLACGPSDVFCFYACKLSQRVPILRNGVSSCIKVYNVLRATMIIVVKYILSCFRNRITLKSRVDVKYAYYQF